MCNIITFKHFNMLINEYSILKIVFLFNLQLDLCRCKTKMLVDIKFSIASGD